MQLEFEYLCSPLKEECVSFFFKSLRGKSKIFIQFYFKFKKCVPLYQVLIVWNILCSLIQALVSFFSGWIHLLRKLLYKYLHTYLIWLCVVWVWVCVQMASNDPDPPDPSADPQPGDLIEIFRPAYQHWALYLGDGYIINLTPVGQFLPKRKTSPEFYLISFISDSAGWHGKTFIGH